MKKFSRYKLWIYFLIIFCVCTNYSKRDIGLNSGSYTEFAKKIAEDILNKTGINGGFVVHVNCGDGKLTAALYRNDSYVIEGLTTDTTELNKARKYIQSWGLYGPVSIECWDGKDLPYIDNVVNLLIVEEESLISMDEVMRVLSPRGIAYIKENGRWRKEMKPWPEEIDEWTHFLHDSDNNAVADDKTIGPPRHLQWIGSPKWTRHHNHLASLCALVSSNGKIFYILDEGPSSSIYLPPEWKLIARDAFNGTVLWKRNIENWWDSHLWSIKGGPANIPRRLIANGNRIYVTLGIDAPVSVLDSETGETIQIYKDTKTAEEMVLSNGIIFLLVNHDKKPTCYSVISAHGGTERNRVNKEWAWDEQERRLMAVETKSGKILWDKKAKVIPMTLAASGGDVFFHNGEKIICLNGNNGKEQWSSKPIPRLSLVPTGYSPSLVIHQGIVLFAGLRVEISEKDFYIKDDISDRKSLFALSAKTGEILWEARHPLSGHWCPEDVLAIDSLVWGGAISSPPHSGLFIGRNIHTGEIKKKFYPDVETFFMHQRCYPSKATTKYLLPSRTGIEFIDTESEHWEIHHWVRGGCLYGIMPANGLIYTPPHPCACYFQSKLRGLQALAPSRNHEFTTPNEKSRLEKGPAYENIKIQGVGDKDVEDWPTYRHDNDRNASINTHIPVGLEKSWEIKLGGKLTSPVAANGRLFVASVNEHKIYALDSEDGKILWSYTVGGPVDSPPTIYKGRVIFGSSDGWVYCLRESDGKLSWRYLAAPTDRRLLSFGHVESVWPVHGSILIEDNTIYCVAGRSMFLDGGIRFLRLDPESGRKISETILDHRVPETDKNLQTEIKVLTMPVGLPDILSSDDNYIYMRGQQFNLKGKRTHITPAPVDDKSGKGRHLFSPAGFLDDSWLHRVYWIHGRNAGEGWGGWIESGWYSPYGRILVFDNSTVYGYQRNPEYLCNGSVLEYRLFAASKDVRAERIDHVRNIKINGKSNNWESRSHYPDSDLTAIDYIWVEEDPTLLVHAMVLANNTLFIAGPPYIVNEKDIFGKFHTYQTQAKIERQVDALHGMEGSILQAVSASDGKKLAEYRLKSLPIFDGLIAAKGKLYLCTKKGEIICFGG